MFKKLVLVVMSLLLVFTIGLSGCTNGDDNGNTKTEDGFKIAKEDLKVGVVFISPVNDGGYSTMHYNGIEKMITDVGLNDSQIITKENVSDSDDSSKNVIISLINEGCNVIIGTSYGYGKIMYDLAAEYEDVIFLHCSGSYKNDTNMANYFGRMYQARFLSGLAAGLKTESNKIGYVAAQPYAEVIRGINAFTLGVRAVNPDATVKVLWTNSWYEPNTEKTNAETLIADGCDVITQHQDSTSAQIAAQEKGVFSIGYNGDMSEVAPDAHLTAPSWDWSKYYTTEIKSIIDGTWEPSAKWPGLESGIVYLSELSDFAAEGTQEKVDEYKAKIEDGSFKVFGGREIKDNEGNVVVTADTVTLSDEELLSMNWLVEGVIGEVPKVQD